MGSGRNWGRSWCKTCCGLCSTLRNKFWSASKQMSLKLGSFLEQNLARVLRRKNPPTFWRSCTPANPLNSFQISGVKWLHFIVFRAILYKLTVLTTLLTFWHFGTQRQSARMWKKYKEWVRSMWSWATWLTYFCNNQKNCGTERVNSVQHPVSSLRHQHNVQHILYFQYAVL